MDWLREHQPHCAKAIEGAEVLDFVVIKDYSHGCKQMFSEQGWGVTGESGVFTDPFYSPGSDFIAINNTFINDLICRSAKGENIQLESRFYQGLNQSFFESTLSLYTGQYGGFGDRRMMSLKLVWDYAYYWGVLSLLFFKSAMTDIALMRELKPVLIRSQEANAVVQSGFRGRAKQRLTLPAQGIFLDQYLVPCLRHFNNVLINESVNTKAAMVENVEMLERLKIYVLDMLDDKAVTNISNDESDLLGKYRHYVLA